MDLGLVALASFSFKDGEKKKTMQNILGLVRDLNPGPLAPKARIIPLDQRANLHGLLSYLRIFIYSASHCMKTIFYFSPKPSDFLQT